MGEIEYWVARGFSEFYFQDDNFTINREKTLEFCRLLTRSNIGIKYKISSRVDYCDDELVAMPFGN